MKVRALLLQSKSNNDLSVRTVNPPLIGGFSISVSSNKVRFNICKKAWNPCSGRKGFLRMVREIFRYRHPQVGVNREFGCNFVTY